MPHDASPVDDEDGLVTYSTLITPWWQRRFTSFAAPSHHAEPEPGPIQAARGAWPRPWWEWGRPQRRGRDKQGAGAGQAERGGGTSRARGRDKQSTGVGHAERGTRS